MSYSDVVSPPRFPNCQSTVARQNGSKNACECDAEAIRVLCPCHSICTSPKPWYLQMLPNNFASRAW